MKNQINISNLTPEQIEDLRQQLKAFDEQPKTIMDKVKSWKDALQLNEEYFYIDYDSKIEPLSDISSPDLKEDINLIPSQKHAKSILATSQLMVIAEALNEGWKPNWDDIEEKYGINYDGSDLDVYGSSIACYNAIVFKSEEIAEYVIAQFPELWYDCFMIDKPTK